MTDHNHSEEISTLNTLIATTIDSITGYENSAKDVDSERFREMFRQRADERQRVVEELRSEVRRLGGNPEDDGSFMGNPPTGRRMRTDGRGRLTVRVPARTGPVRVTVRR